MSTEHKHHEGHAGMNHDGHAGHVMDHGISHLEFAGLSAVVLSFILVGLTVRNTETRVSRRWDLFRIWGVERVVKSRYFSFLLRLIPAGLFLLVIATGLLGRERANFAAPFTWLFWWTLLVFFVALGGKIFCAACPWDFFANLFQFGWFHRLKGKVQTLGIKWPKRWANIYLAIALFLLLTWLELGLEVAYSSYATAIVGLILVGIVILFALVFEKRAFCRYACPVGNISGIYSQFSPVELRTKDPSVCKTCRSKECTRGGPVSTPCPVGLVPFQLKENTYCTLCTECVRSCQSDNLTLKVRKPGVDLEEVRPARRDEMALVFTILVLTFFHGLTMIPVWGKWLSALQTTGIGYLTSFTLLMTAILAVTFGFYWFLCQFIDRRIGQSGTASRLIYACVPLVLGYHVGHNTMHFLGEGAHLVPLLNDPFGWGWNIFGWQDFKPSPILDHVSVRWIQMAAVGLGFYFSIRALASRTQQLAGSTSNARTLFLTHYLLFFAVGLLGLWFIFQPMVMRSTY